MKKNQSDKPLIVPQKRHELTPQGKKYTTNDKHAEQDNHQRFIRALGIQMLNNQYRTPQYLKGCSCVATLNEHESVNENDIHAHKLQAFSKATHIAPKYK